MSFNVISLFDGISCGQVAFDKLGIKFDGENNKYFASEINEKSKKITRKNYPNTYDIGDVSNVHYENNCLYKNCKKEDGIWILGEKVFDGKIDILIGGSPCQDISNLNKKHLGLKGQKSILFYEYLRILKEINPKYFLLENVIGKKEATDEITKKLKITPILINSKLVSAQNRARYYWTNIPNVIQPKDLNINLFDILQPYEKTRDYIIKEGRRKWLESESGKKSLQKGYISINGKHNKAQCLTRRAELSWNSNYIKEKDEIRTLTEIEYERLQTLPDNYTKVDGINKNDRYQIIGDGWTVDVIKHILSSILK